MKKRKEAHSVYEYLDSTGILETGNSEEIFAARRAYWNAYRAQWRRQQRMKKSEFTVSFTKKEMQLLGSVATNHHRSVTKFIHDATLGYITQSYVVHDSQTINELKAILTRTFCVLQNIEENNGTDHCTKSLTEIVTNIEHKIFQELLQPIPLESVIKKVLQTIPDAHQKIVEIFNEYSNGD